MKKGQITVFIIIGLIILFVIGTVLYVTRTRVTKEFVAARPAVLELPQKVQPLRDLVEVCIERLAVDGLRRIGDQGGYVDISHIPYNAAEPTDGRAIQFSPGAGPVVAYWWHMKSKNTCEQDCIFDSERPPLYRAGGTYGIETQLDKYINNNLKACVGNFEEFRRQGCTVQERAPPEVTTNVAEEDIFFVGKYPLRAICDEQTFDVEDYYVSVNLNLKEIYNLATDLTNFQSENFMLEQATKTLLTTYGGVQADRLPPIRALNVGPPSPSVYWVKIDVLEKIKGLLMSYIPLIQVSSVGNYNYISAPPGTRDPEFFELTYNRQFFIPLNTTHRSVEVRFTYLDWWKPYFDINCKGQICRADSASGFDFIPFSINRYQFAYDISYPVLVEIRNPRALDGAGYSFKFFLEENMRNSKEFAGDLPKLEAASSIKPPSIFCDPDQRTSGEISLFVKDGVDLNPMDGATVSFNCGGNNCNLGKTDEEGMFTSKFPRCLGGAILITKADYATHAQAFDTSGEKTRHVDILLEPVRTLQATIKNYPITKFGKHASWQYREGVALRPPENQTATIQLSRIGTPYDEPFTSILEISGAGTGEVKLIPGEYEIRIISFLEDDLTIPKDQRCIKYRKGLKKKKKCFFVPDKPIEFNITKPFPYGGAEYEYHFTSSRLRGRTKIEFRQFVLAMDKVSEPNRIVEDLNQIDKYNDYANANIQRIYPVIR